jgi:hypothetical protein
VLVATELLHLPDKPAGVVEEEGKEKCIAPSSFLAAELLHLPDKPAGVISSTFSTGAADSSLGAFPACCYHILHEGLK